MSHSIEIGSCSAVLYHSTQPCEAHAGNSRSIQKWIGDQMSVLGKIHVDGWERLKVLREAEELAAEELLNAAGRE